MTNKRSFSDSNSPLSKQSLWIVFIAIFIAIFSRLVSQLRHKRWFTRTASITILFLVSVTLCSYAQYTYITSTGGFQKAVGTNNIGPGATGGVCATGTLALGGVPVVPTVTNSADANGLVVNCTFTLNRTWAGFTVWTIVSFNGNGFNGVAKTATAASWLQSKAANPGGALYSTGYGQYIGLLDGSGALAGSTVTATADFTRAAAVTGIAGADGFDPYTLIPSSGSVTIAPQITSIDLSITGPSTPNNLSQLELRSESSLVGSSNGLGTLWDLDIGLFSNGSYSVLFYSDPILGLNESTVEQNVMNNITVSNSNPTNLSLVMTSSQGFTLFSATVPTTQNVTMDDEALTLANPDSVPLGADSSEPTLPQWAAIIMGLALVTFSIFRMRRQYPDAI
jgi:hypothetical protein